MRRERCVLFTVMVCTLGALSITMATVRIHTTATAHTVDIPTDLSTVMATRVTTRVPIMVVTIGRLK